MEALQEEERAPDMEAAASVEVAAGPGVTLEPLRATIRGYVRDAWHGRALLPRLGARFLAKFIYGTKLGRSWLIIRPLMDSLGMTLLFGTVLRVGAPNDVPYYLFLMSGLVGWRLLERGLRYSCRSFNIYRKMMKTFRMPLLLVPLSAMAYPLVEITIYALVLIGATFFFWDHTGTFYLQGPPQLLLIVPGYALLSMTLIGGALWVSVLNAKARDTRFVLRYVMAPWMFVTPIVYPITQLRGTLRTIGELNPMTAPIGFLQQGLTGTGAASITTTSVAASLVFGGLILGSGLWFYAREAARSIDALASDLEV